MLLYATKMYLIFIALNKKKQAQRNVLRFPLHNIPKAAEITVFKDSDLGDTIIKKRKEIVTTED